MSDGRIVVDTKLNNDGIKKDLQTVQKTVENTGKKITDSMNKAEKSVNNIGKTFKNVDMSKISKQLENVSKSIEKTNESIEKQQAKLAKLKTAYEKATNVDQKNKIQEQMQKTEQSITKLESKLTGLNNKRITLDSAKSSINDLDGNFKSASVSINNSLDKIESKAKQTGKTIENSLVNAGNNIGKVGDKISSVGDTLTRNVTLPTVGLGVAIGKIGMDFDSQMSRVKAISEATGEEFTKLHDQALELGASTAFSAKETALGMESLASAGFSTNEIMAAMPGMLDLAASSGEGLASSADIAASTLRGFGLAADQAGHVADVLAKNASKTNAAVGDTGEAMKYIAPAAKSAGLGLEEVTAAIGIMANSGIKGSQAGTTLRSALTRLASPAKEAAQAMDSIGFSAFDNSGKMLPLKDILTDLKKGLEGLTDQDKQDKIATIFGQEAMSGILTLVDAGPEALDNLTQSYKNANGVAAEMAKTMQDNSKSAVEQMFGSMETAAIKIEENFAPLITELANNIGKLADEFGALTPEQQKFYVELVAGVAAAGPLLKLVGGLVSGIGTLTKVGGGIGKLLGIGTIATETATATAGATGLTTALSALTPAIIPVVGALGGLGLVIAGLNTAQDQMKDKLTTTTDGMSEWQKAINGMTGYTFKSKKELEELGLEYKEFGENIGDDFKKKVEESTESLHKFQLFLSQINIDGLIDEAESNDFNKQIEKMVNDAIATIDSKKAETQKKLSDLFSSDDGKIDETEQKTLNTILENYDKQKSEEQQLKEEVIKIKQDAVNRKEILNQQEIKDIENKTRRIREIELEATGGTQEEKDYAKNEFGARVEGVSATDASSLLKDKRAELDEQNVQIKAAYDTQLDLLKRNLAEADEANKASIQAEIDKFTKLRDDKTKLKNDEWQAYINLLKQKNPEALAMINEFTGEVLSKEDLTAQQRLTSMKQTYSGLSNIVKSGTYELENVQTGSLENITVTVDEATGKIIGAYSETSMQVGGYTQQMAQDNEKVGQSHAEMVANAQQAMNDLGSAHIDASGKIISSSGQAVGALEDIVTENGEVVSGIYELNGTPIKVEVNKDGTIKNLGDIISQIKTIPKTVPVNVVVSTFGISATSSAISGLGGGVTVPKIKNNYTGTNGGDEGFTFKDEHGWEMSTGENELYYLGGGTGILDHGSSVNQMKQDVAKAVDGRFGAIISKLINSMSSQNNLLSQVVSNTDETVKNGEQSIQLNQKLATDLVNGMKSTTGNFGTIQNQLDNAKYDVDKANLLSIEDNQSYIVAKSELERLNDLSSDAKKAIGEDELQRQKDNAEKSLEIAKKTAELDITITKEAAEEKQKIAEQNKNNLIKLSEAVTTAIKNELEEQKAAAEKVHQDKLKNLEEEYNKEIANIDKITAKNIKAIDEQLEALEEKTTETSREEEREASQNSISVLTAKMNNTASEADKRAYALQIENAKKELEQKENEWNVEDEKAALEEEKALLAEKAEAKKENLQEEYENQKSAEEEKLKATDEYYNKLLETDSINSQARYTMLTANNDELVNLLNSYAPNWQDAGQTLADSLLTGLNSQKQSVQDAINQMISLRSGASSSSTTTSGYYTGTNYNRVAGVYKTNEKGFEMSTSGDVAYVSQGAAISNNMQTKAYIQDEISKQVALMRSSLLSSQIEMQSLMVGAMARSSSSNSTIQNDNSFGFKVENLHLNTGQDVEQLANELNCYYQKQQRH